MSCKFEMHTTVQQTQYDRVSSSEKQCGSTCWR